MSPRGVFAAPKNALTFPLRLLLAPSAVLRLGEPLFRLMGRRSEHAAANDFRSYQRLLVIRLDEIGDVVLSTAFVRELRRQFPDADITWVVRSGVHNLVALCPYVDRVLGISAGVVAPGLTPLRERASHLVRTFRFASAKLWGLDIQVAIVPRFDTDWYGAAQLAYCSGAFARVGYSSRPLDTAGTSPPNYDVLFTALIATSADLHEAERGRELLQHLGLRAASDELELWFSDDDHARAATLLGSAPDHPVVALGVGAGHPSRRWPAESFRGVAADLIACGFSVVVLGDAGDERAGELIVQQTGGGALNLTGRCSLRETAAVLKRCALYIGNDSAPMHMAAAVKTPVVEISSHPQSGAPDHARSPRRFGPWKVPHRVLQPERPLPPCTDSCTQPAAHCIKQITVEEVLAAARTLVGSSST